MKLPYGLVKLGKIIVGVYAGVLAFIAGILTVGAVIVPLFGQAPLWVILLSVPGVAVTVILGWLTSFILEDL